MSLSRLASAALLLLALPACAPKRPPAPAPAPAPAMVQPTAEESEEARRRTAQMQFDQAVLLGRQSRWPEAEARYREAVRALPDEPSYHLALASTLLAQGRDSEAADALLAGIRAEEALAAPNHRVLVVDYERLVRILDRVGRADEARTARIRMQLHRDRRDAELPR